MSILQWFSPYPEFYLLFSLLTPTLNILNISSPFFTAGGWGAGCVQYSSVICVMLRRLAGMRLTNCTLYSLCDWVWQSSLGPWQCCANSNLALEYLVGNKKPQNGDLLWEVPETPFSFSSFSDLFESCGSWNCPVALFRMSWFPLNCHLLFRRRKYSKSGQTCTAYPHLQTHRSSICPPSSHILGNLNKNHLVLDEAIILLNW